MRHFLVLLTALASFVGTSHVAHAATTYECSYSKAAALHRWQREFKADRFIIKEVTDFKMKFSVDETFGKGYVHGGFGPEPVQTRYSQNNRMITFFETTSSGNLYFTSIDLESGDTVHSQHIFVINGSFLPSQYYGHCKVVPNT